MFRWFAPLLLFAGKPDVVIRIAIVAFAAAVLAFGVWLASNIALTVDSLKNPYIAAIYGIVLFCFFAIVSAVAWLRLRRHAPSVKPAPPVPVPEVPLPTEIVTRRAQEISKRWDRTTRRPAAQVKDIVPAKPAAAALAATGHAKSAARAMLTVTGPAYTGKTALIATLSQATSTNPSETSDIVGLVDANPIDGEEPHLAALIASAATTDGVLFVVDQDLRAPEVAAITRIVAAGKPLYVVLNKADQFNAADRDAILVSIRAKMPVKFAPAHVVAVAGAPSPVERQIEDARGAVRIELRRPSSDIEALKNLLYRVIPPAPERTLRFERQP